MPGDGLAGPPRWSLVLVALAIAYGAYRRSVDLDPPTLWLDDLWVAVLARAPLEDGLRSGATSPPGFLLPVFVAIRAIGDPELGAQLFPFACSLLAIALVAAAAWRYTRQGECMALAAMLVSCDPVAIPWATHVKQYASDLVVAALHLLFLHRLAAAPTTRALWTWVGVTAVGFLVSTSSLFIAAAFFPVAALAARDRLPPRAIAGACAATGLCAASVYALLVRGAVNDMLRDYWARQFVDGPRFAALALGRWLAQPWHGLDGEGRPSVVVALLAAGLALAALRARAPATRALVGASGLLVVLVLGSSAAGWFPVGTGRIEQFLLPPLVVCMVCGIAALAPERPARRTAWRAALAAIALVHLPAPRVPTYVSEGTGPLVGELAARKRDEDAVLVNLRATYGLAYYGPWPVRLVPRPRLPQGFYPLPETPNVHVLQLIGVPTAEALRAATGDDPPRVFVLLCHPDRGTLARVEEHFVRHGWRRDATRVEGGTLLFEFSRPP